MTAVNHQVATGHKRAGITQRKQSRAPKLFGPCQPAHHILSLPGSASRRGLLKDLLDHGRDNMARTEAIHPYPMPAPFHSQTPAQLDDRSLGRVVHGAGHTLVRNQPAHARHEQDRPAALVPKHLLRRRRRAVEHPIVVDPHHFVERLLRMSDGAVYVVDARRADHAVEALLVAGNLGDEFVDMLFIAHVDSRVVHAAAVRSLGALLGGLEFLVGRFEAVETPYCREELRTDG